MVSPMMNLTRSGNRRNKRSPVGMTVVSPSESVSPLNSKMTPTRKMLLQRRRFSSHSRNGAPPFDAVQIEDDLRDDIREPDKNFRSSANKREGNMKFLHERFNHIQQGLGTIDEERNLLLERTKKLEKEMKLTQQQLELREREILALVKRCASQEEKVKESSKLRSENRELQHHLDIVKRRLNEIGDENEDLFNLKKKLQQSELDRECLQDCLAKLQREHDSVTDTLQECLSKIHQLTEEKHQNEEERRRERRRAELELEKQHLAHIADTNNLKGDMQMQQTRILQMEKILQDNMYTNTALRREKAIWSQGNHEVHQVVQKYESKLAELRQQIDQTAREKEEAYERELKRVTEQMDDAIKVTEKEGEREMSRLKVEMNEGYERNFVFEKEIQLMKEKLEARDSLIEGLQSEFSAQMEALMSKQSSLDQAEEERKILKEKVDLMRNLETEHAGLLDFVQILDSNLAGLTSENAHLILEKDTLLDEAEESRKKVGILQQQLESLQNNWKAREKDFCDLLNAEKDELRSELEEHIDRARKEVSFLHVELNSRSEWISKLESELRNSRRQIIENEDEICKINNEMEILRSNLTCVLRKARLEVAALESAIFSQDQNLASIEGRLETAKKALEGVAATINGEAGEERLNIENTGVSRTNDSVLDPQDGIVQESPECVDENAEQKESINVRVKLEMKLQCAQNEAVFLKREIASLSSEKTVLAEEVGASRRIIEGRDDQVVSLQQSLLHQEKREKELERLLSDTTKELERSSCHIAEGNKVSGFWTLDDSEHCAGSPLVKRLREKGGRSHHLVSDREERVKTLEEELSHAQKLREEMSVKLEIAKERISELEAKILGDSEETCIEQLELQLKEATYRLSEHKQQAERVETEYQANLKCQMDQEMDRNQIAILENVIRKLNLRASELETEVKVGMDWVTEKNEAISTLKKEVIQGEEGRNTLLSQLTRKNVEAETLTSQVASKQNDITTLQADLAAVNASLEEKEIRIKELESEVICNNSSLEKLEEALSEADAKITGLEQNGNPSSDNQSHSRENSLAQGRKEVEELKGKIQTLLASQTELATELENTRNALEEEKCTCGTKEKKLEEEIRKLKTELVVAQGGLTDRKIRIKKLEVNAKKNKELFNGLEETLGEAHKTTESLRDQKRELSEKCVALELEISETRNALNEKYNNLAKKHLQTLESLEGRDSLISSLREMEKERDEICLILESQLSDARNGILELEQEIEARGSKIESLEREIDNLSGEMRLAFVESEKRKSHLERDLTSVEKKYADLWKEMEASEKRWLEVDEELKMARKANVASMGGECEELDKKIKSFDETFLTREDCFMKGDLEIESMKEGSQKEQEKMQTLQSSKIYLENALERANKEIAQKESLIKFLENAVDKYKIDFEKECQKSSAHAQKESSFHEASKKVSELERQNAELTRKLEEKSQRLAIVQEDLLEAKNGLGNSESSTPEETSKLESQIKKLTMEVALRDDEIRELRLVELKDAEEMIASLSEEVTTLTEQALQKNLERTAEKGRFTTEIDQLNSDLKSISLQTMSQQQNFQKESEEKMKEVSLLQSTKQELESQLSEMNDVVKVRDCTIKSLIEAISIGEERDMEVCDELNKLRLAEKEAREELVTLKGEIEIVTTREKEMADVKVRNRETLHKEEMDHTLLELQSNVEKLKESESLLKERSCLLGEMHDKNKEIESRLEKEQKDQRHIEELFAQSQVDLEQTRKDLKKCQDELRRKESVLQSKLKEERESKEFTEVSLNKLKIQYNEAMTTKKCVMELERQNSELKDKVRRQEAYLQRKLDKEKMGRARLTPTKSITGKSPAKIMSARTPTKRTANMISGRMPPPVPNAFTIPPRGSKLQVPSTVRSGSKSILKSPTAFPSSLGYLSTTPARKNNIPTCLDRSMTSELSSLLRTPPQSKEHLESTVVPDWEMEL